MTTKHTPGPWCYHKGSDPHNQGQIYSEATGATVAISYSDEGGANAALIAAAPEMLAALEAFVRDRATCPTTNGKDLAAWDDMRAAIAKAKP